MKLAFLFPGQGSQAVGMGRAFVDGSAAAKSIYAEANDALGFDLAKLSFEGPASELELTANTQPALLTASVAAAAACAERGLEPDMVAGHSLGEYAALVVARSLRFTDAVQIVRKRGQFMQEAVPVGSGAMAAILGLELPAVEAVCADAAKGEIVTVANVNSAGQTVIAGHRAAVERAVALAAERGGRKSRLLPVSAPFHCPLMQPAADRLASELAGIAVADPRIPVVRNVDAGITRAAVDVVPFLIRQVASPVRWSQCVERLAGDGVTVFVEAGPGRVLTALVRRIVDGTQGLSVEDPVSLDKALAALGIGGAASGGVSTGSRPRSGPRSDSPRARGGGASHGHAADRGPAKPSSDRP
jgi:[acyl-carrier-protein] S-malonyltransferase